MSKKWSVQIAVTSMALLTSFGAIAGNVNPDQNKEVMAATLAQLSRQGEILRDTENGDIIATAHATQVLEQLGITLPESPVNNEVVLSTKQADQLLEQLRSTLSPENFLEFTQGISLFNSMSFGNGGG